MSIDNLDLVRGRGRAAKPPVVTYEREMTSTDIERLESQRGAVAPARKKLRDRHHSVARYLAMGMKPGEDSAVTGFAPSTISILRADPTFNELVTFYRENTDARVAEFHERTVSLAIDAVNELHERLEDTEEVMSSSMVLEVAKFAADRTGHAPQTHSTNIQVNNFSDRLAEARQRLSQAPHLRAITQEDEA
jgi:hypothetical protein